MSNRIPWFERKFSFDFPVEWYPEFIERLRGLPARAEEHVARAAALARAGAAPADILTRRENGRGWSILENLGHLIILDDLWERRLDDYLSGEPTLSAADLTNAATNTADFNRRPPEAITAELRQIRGDFVERLEGLDSSVFGRAAVHPRLNLPMRLVDGLYFSACHDDYHLARVWELVRSASAATGNPGQ